MKNNLLKLDDYIQQFYALPELMHIRKKNGNKIRHIQRVLVFQPPKQITKIIEHLQIRYKNLINNPPRK